MSLWRRRSHAAEETQYGAASLYLDQDGQPSGGARDDSAGIPAWVTAPTGNQPIVGDGRTCREGLDINPQLAVVPDVPEGTRLHLRPGDWASTSTDLAAGDLDVIVSRCADAADADGMVTVVGHHLACGWPSVEEHPPCVELRVTVRALAAAAAATHEPE